MTIVREHLDRQIRNPYVSGWARLSLWAVAHVDRHGHARAYAGQLRQECAFTSSKALSQAIDQARARGLVDQCSTAGCLVLPGQSLAPCGGRHRDGGTRNGRWSS